MQISLNKRDYFCLMEILIPSIVFEFQLIIKNLKLKYEYYCQSNCFIYFRTV